MEPQTLQAESAVQAVNKETAKEIEGADLTPENKPFTEAKTRHQENLNHLTKLLDTGEKAAAKDTRFGAAWPNSCAWLKSGKTKLHALTETHDSAARATAQGKAGKKAMFGIGTAWPTHSDYNAADVNDGRNIYCALPSWLGFRRASSPSMVVIIEPTLKNDDLVQETIVHEVQHDADHHGSSDLDGYTTEFRAYWIDGTYRAKSAAAGSADASLTASDGTKLEGFDSARQQAIFAHLYNSASYPYVAEGWKNDAAFKAAVLAMKAPAGTNLTNSTRVDELFLAVQAKKDAATLEPLIAALTAEDKATLSGASHKADWARLLEASYSADDAVKLKKALGL